MHETKETIDAELIRAHNEMEWLNLVIFLLDENNPNKYWPPSEAMKTISDAVNNAPESERQCIDSLLATILSRRLTSSDGWKIEEIWAGSKSNLMVTDHSDDDPRELAARAAA